MWLEHVIGNTIGFKVGKICWIITQGLLDHVKVLVSHQGNEKLLNGFRQGCIVFPQEAHLVAVLSTVVGVKR